MIFNTTPQPLSATDGKCAWVDEYGDTIMAGPYPPPPRIDMLTIMIAKAHHYLFGMGIYPTRWCCWSCMQGDIGEDNVLHRVQQIQTGQASGIGVLRPIYFIKPRQRVNSCAECRLKRSKRRRQGITPPLTQKPYVLQPILPPGTSPKRFT